MGNDLGAKQGPENAGWVNCLHILPYFADGVFAVMDSGSNYCRYKKSIGSANYATG